MNSLAEGMSAPPLNTRLPYLRQVTGYMGRQMTKERHVDQFMLDHSYSKPWNSHPFASRTKPARLLFFTYPTKLHLPSEQIIGDNIDIESLDQPSSLPPYEMTKAKSQMNEWENHLSNICVDESQDDWEEVINRTGWTIPQNRLFAKVSKILNAHYLAKLSYAGSNNEPVMRRIYVDKGSKRLRQVLASVHWDFTLIQWLHSTLLENLSVSYLSGYLDMLHSLKTKVPALVNKILVGTQSVGRAAITGPETFALWNRRPWDPILPSLAYNKLKKLPGSPLILVVPFAPSQGICNQTKRMRFWLAQLANMGKVIPVTMYAPGGGRSVIVTQCMEHIIGATRTKINELKDNFPNRPVILIGWGVGSVIACHVGLQEWVAAVVCLGFQMTGLKGTRGDVDDSILESRVPTLFVVGQNSPVCKVDDIEEFREKMKTETSLVIVGGADEWLRINHFKKKEEGITQTVVDRCLLDEISNFLGGTLTSLPFQTADCFSNARYGPRQPIVRENKRRKRKLDTILEFDDEGGVEAPAAKWKASSIIKNDAKANIYSNLTMPIPNDKKSLSPPEAVLQPVELFLKSGVKINAATGKRSYVRKPRVHVPIIPESTSSDSSSTSFVSSNKSCQDVEEVVVNSTPNANPSSLSTTANSANGLSFNIGFLSSLGQVRRNQNAKPGPKLNSNFIIRSPEAKTLPASEFNPPTSTSSVIHLYKALSNSNGKSNPLSIYSVPARSAFSIHPRAGLKPTIGIPSVMTYATLSRNRPASPNTSSSILIPEASRPIEVDGQKASPSEPDQEQVQAIQKLQFHDFPLTTASLTKTTTGISITQAKILSSYNLDLKKLQSFTTASALSNSNLYIATTPKPQKSPVVETTSNLPLNKPITSYTISSMMNAAAAQEEKVESTSSLVPVVLFASGKEADGSLPTGDFQSVSVNEPDTDLSTVETPKISDIPDINRENVGGESSVKLPEPKDDNLPTQGSLTSSSLMNESDSEEVKVLGELGPQLKKDEKGADSSPEIIVCSPPTTSTTTTTTSRGKFKAPFPTIAATRTRRIRTPKYMYYDL